MDVNRKFRSAPSTPKQISALFGIPVATIHGWLEEGLEHDRRAGKVFIYGEDLRAFEKEKREKGEPMALDPLNPANEQLAEDERVTI